MRRILLLICCLSIIAIAQSSLLDSLQIDTGRVAPAALHIWWDNNPTRTRLPIISGTRQLDVSGLSEGVHTLHCQVWGTDSLPYSIRSAMFLKLLESTDSSATSNLRYWFDEESTTANRASTGVQLLDVSTLSNGVHTLHCQVVNTDNTPSSIRSSMFMKLGIGSGGIGLGGLRYWFDEEADSANVISTGVQLLDVSTLSNGVHTLHCQVINADNTPSSIRSSMFMKLGIGTGEAGFGGLRYWFDSDTDSAKLISTGVQLLDVSDLSDGVHTLHCQVINADNMPSSIRSSMFVKMNAGASSSSVEGYRYWFDKEPSMHTMNVSTTIIPTDSLRSGLHTLHMQLISEINSPVRSTFFYKIPPGGEGITRYEYWLNDVDSTRHIVNLPAPENPMELITMLDVAKMPIRSTCFQFAFRSDTIPVIYAKNDLHFFFWDAAGHLAQTIVQYVDENVVDTIQVTDSLQRNTLRTIARPASNAIQWYTFDVVRGDSVAFRTDKACTLHIFSPSGEEIYSASGTEAVKLGGIHAATDGTYYLAVHDMMASGSSLSLYYQHVDRYAILNYDVHKVGNGGVSTITFDGNGFNELYSVDLIHPTSGDTIHSEYVSHENNTITSIVFDFDSASLGMYLARFNFVEDTLSIVNAVEVEAAIPITLTSNVTFPQTFTRGTTVTYTLEITNEGNMTAYNVPMYVYISTPTIDGISHLEFKGLSLPTLDEYFNTDSLTEIERQELKQWAASVGEDHYFLKVKDIDADNNDSIIIRVGYFFTDISPYQTKEFQLILLGSESVDVWMSTPKDWFIAFSSDSIHQNGQRENSRSMRKSTVGGFCCWHTGFEKWMDGASIVSALASLALTETGAPAVVAAGVSCATGALGAISSASASYFCEQNRARWQTGISIGGVLASCIGAYPKIAKAIAGGILSNIGIKGSLLDWGTNLKDPRCSDEHDNPSTDNPTSSSADTPESSSRVATKGGKSQAVQPIDPNEIRGHVSESGSKYIGEEIQEITYTIEFENDPAFATAPAHTIIVRDTLDQRYFDLTSFAPSAITLGKKTLQLNGEQNFTRTLDLRNDINVIAQIKQEYNPVTGIVAWTITSLDPMSIEPIHDAYRGVLPVNYGGSGIGYVSYSIRLKQDLQDGTAIPNLASIVFDNNEPILTPVWINTIDRTRPHSRILAVENQQDTATAIRITGSDNLSGIWKYEVYAVCDSTDVWAKIGECLSDTLNTVTTFVYDSYASECNYRTLALDSAGNREITNKYAIVLYADSTMGIVTGSGLYNYGATAILTAIPHSGYEFERWSDDVTANPRHMVVESDHVLYAIFRQGISTLLEQTKTSDTVVKYIRNGHLYIIRQGKIYNAQGALVH